MDSVHDEPRGQPVLGKLVPDIVRVARQHGVGAVAEVRGHRRPGGDGCVDLRCVAAMWPMLTTIPSRTAPSMYRALQAIPATASPAGPRPRAASCIRCSS